jgi:hypothetical protein
MVLTGRPFRQIDAMACCAILRPFDGLFKPGVRQGRSYQFDSCMMASHSGETLVARQQRSVERFGKGDVDGIMGREIVPQIPDTRQKEIMRYRRKGKSARSARAARPRLLSISPFAAYRRMTCATSISSR